MNYEIKHDKDKPRLEEGETIIDMDIYHTSEWSREQWKDWAINLKAGEHVVIKSFGVVVPAVVQRITPGGKVRTNKGLFAQLKYCDWYRGVGTSGFLEPATPEMWAQAVQDEEKRAEAKKQYDRIQKAKSIAYRLCYGPLEINQELAQILIEYAEKAKKEAHHDE